LQAAGATAGKAGRYSAGKRKVETDRHWHRAQACRVSWIWYCTVMAGRSPPPVEGGNKAQWAAGSWHIVGLYMDQIMHAVQHFPLAESC
jgi:hypothetical protein